MVESLISSIKGLDEERLSRHRRCQCGASCLASRTNRCDELVHLGQRTNNDFDEERDSLFLFELEEPTTDVSLRRVSWAKQGDAVGWLTSPVFGLEQVRSKEAEVAIEAAEAFMRGDVAKRP